MKVENDQAFCFCCINVPHIFFIHAISQGKEMQIFFF